MIAPNEYVYSLKHKAETTSTRRPAIASREWGAAASTTHAQAEQPHHRLDQAELSMPCDTGSLGSITASARAAWQHCPINARAE
ncbi:hypothetical protein [Thauera aromatica]|uniref:hypothetical protein n=1 Tax=Thauera aromatica TaxID=59405 RepID=UPI001FFC468D|nr:hypothetical protein [Thauera aromatica]MCK2095886.1 hypothetical protein [Thauera aromatica]